jgi:hypothetical protein
VISRRNRVISRGKDEKQEIMSFKLNLTPEWNTTVTEGSYEAVEVGTGIKMRHHLSLWKEVFFSLKSNNNPAEMLIGKEMIKFPS